jgi:hypothetical protein
MRIGRYPSWANPVAGRAVGIRAKEQRGPLDRRLVRVRVPAETAVDRVHRVGRWSLVVSGAGVMSASGLAGAKGLRVSVNPRLLAAAPSRVKLCRVGADTDLAGESRV